MRHLEGPVEGTLEDNMDRAADRTMARATPRVTMLTTSHDPGVCWDCRSPWLGNVNPKLPAVVFETESVIERVDPVARMAAGCD